MCLDSPLQTLLPHTKLQMTINSISEFHDIATLFECKICVPSPVMYHNFETVIFIVNITYRT